MTLRPTIRPVARSRWWLWVPLLVLALWLALFGDKSPAGDTGISQPTRAPGATKAAPVAQTSIQHTAPADIAVLIELLPRAQLASPAPQQDATAKVPSRDLFSAHSWTPPRAAPVAAPPAPPSAPALPYVYLGKKLETGAWEVYLGRGEQSFIAREGLVLEGIYRVDQIEPPSLTLTYLPLNQAQTLPIGELR